jgi:glutamyl-tRNA synthetase/glutamyl-Q tRNA(Asp) synthetase
MSVVSRFAPAPTGYLHLGHVLNAIYVWGATRALGGRVLLRIEDHDRARSRADYARAILEDLEWLGFVADEPAVWQHDREGIYEAALEDLRRKGLVYACGCSRSAIASLAEPPTEHTRAELAEPVGREFRYPGTCSGRGLVEGPGRGSRVRFARSVERFEDRRRGVIEQCPYEQCGDLLVRDREGYWTYQFAATVDDLEQGVTLVVRGDDLLPSTGRQIQLARLLGRRVPPTFLHHPLLMKSRTQKLSKSDGDSGVRDLRAKGWSSADVIGHAAVLAGLIEARQAVRADEVARLIRE